MDGIYSACMHERAHHLMLAGFNPEDMCPERVLRETQAQGIPAKLIGL